MIQGLRPSNVAAYIRVGFFSAAVGDVDSEFMAGVFTLRG
jgi:hypothetical protein